MSKQVLASEQEHHQLHVSHNAASVEEPPDKVPRTDEEGSITTEEASGTINLNISQVEEIGITINKIQQETSEILTKWRDEFSAAENFEMLCPARIDELLKEAYTLENNLIDQKGKLKEGLKELSKTLGTLVDATI